MPHDWKAELGNERVPQKTWLEMPAIGLESEFNVFLDGAEINPEPYWKHPSAFIEGEMLKRTKKSSQLPTGGAVYFDRGVIEVVTPVIELAPGCGARAVRSLWEQIGFVRHQLTRWERKEGHHIRLKAYSTHYNISFELTAGEQNRDRNIRRLALLLAYILPIPMMLVAANRRSTGIGVRPRGNRIEVTADFTPDPGLMIAAATLIVGIVREVLSWPSYRLSLLRDLPIPTIEGVIPGKHTTRKGWLTKDFHYDQSPYTSDIDAEIWKTRDGRTMSLRAIGREVAEFFRDSIRRYSDPFSYELLFAILAGRAPSLLELRDRPAAYEDVGRLCRWGMVIPELQNYGAEEELIPLQRTLWHSDSMDDFIRKRRRDRIAHEKTVAPPKPPVGKNESAPPSASPAPRPTPRRPVHAPALMRQNRTLLPQSRRLRDSISRMLPERKSVYVDRRDPLMSQPVGRDRRRRERRTRDFSIPFPDRRLTRSAYEKVFLQLVSGRRLRIGGELYRPVGMKGWYHALFRRDSDGRERLLTIDQLLKKMNDWV